MRAQKGREFPRESICIDEMAHNERGWEIKLVETLSIVGIDPYLGGKESHERGEDTISQWILYRF